MQDAIIRATNNQTNVELASLHATDKIQRDIEDILGRNGLYYERRKNYYVNLGHSPSEIITPLYLAAGYVSLLLKSPKKAAILKSRFMRSAEAYNKVFSSKAPIKVWPKIATILKRTDEVLDKLRTTGKRKVNKRFLKNWRHLTSFLTISRLLGKFDFSANELILFDLVKFTDAEIEFTWEYIFNSKTHSNNGWRRNAFVYELCQSLSQEFKLSGLERVEKLYEFGDNPKRKRKTVSRDFILQVNKLLPPQPWKPGIHRDITKALNCTNREYFSAVKILINEELRFEQKDGVVYDHKGSVLYFDPERVNPDTMKLLNEEE